MIQRKGALASVFNDEVQVYMLILPINILVTNSSVVINMLICYLLYGFLTKHEVIRQLDMCQGFFSYTFFLHKNAKK